mgnify:CR=1 FL=1
MYVTEQLNKRPVSYRPLIFGLNRFIKGIKTGDIALRLGDDEL